MLRSKFEELWKNRYIEQDKGELYDIITLVYNKVKPLDNILEIGVKKGGTLKFWTEMVSDNGRVIGLDNHPGTLNHIRGNNWDIDNEHKDVRFVIADSISEEAFNGVIDHLDGRLLDYIFIDGHHEKPTPRMEFNLYTPLLRPNGMVCIADLGDLSAGTSGAIDLWKNLPEGEKILHVPHHHQGMGFWIKPSKDRYYVFC